jgi:hypothetical protein
MTYRADTSDTPQKLRHRSLAEEPNVRVRSMSVAVIAVLIACVSVARADATLAPADEYFGRFNMSVLGIANAIRDSGTRLDNGADPKDVIAGPLAFATDAMHAWEAQYPSDPWIARDLLALETVYLKVQTDEAFRLASRTEAWLVADFPQAEQCAKARAMLADAGGGQPSAQRNAWERFAALRLPPRY